MLLIVDSSEINDYTIDDYLTIHGVRPKMASAMQLIIIIIIIASHEDEMNDKYNDK